MIESLVAVLLLLTIGYCVRAQRPAQAAQGRRAGAEGDHLRADHRDRDRRARDRRAQSHGARGRPRRSASGCGRPSASRVELDAPDRGRRAPSAQPASPDRAAPRAAGSSRAPADGRPGLRRIRRRSWRPRRPSPTARARAPANAARSGRMIRLLRDFRLIPIVAVRDDRAVRAQDHRAGDRRRLHAGRGSGDSADITGTIPRRRWPRSRRRRRTPPGRPMPQHSWAQQMFNYPDVTGAVGESKAVGAEGAAENGPSRPPSRRSRRRAPAGAPVPVDRPAAARRPSGRCSNGCRSAARSSMRARASSRCARA